MAGITATYYVATDGSALNDGSIGSPWTFAKAVESAIAGSLVYMRGGTYSTTVSVSNAQSRANGAKATFTAYPGEAPVFTGQITLIGCAGLRFVGLDLRHRLVLESSGATNGFLAGRGIECCGCSFTTATGSGSTEGLAVKQGARNIGMYDCTFNADAGGRTSQNHGINCSFDYGQEYIRGLRIKRCAFERIGIDCIGPNGVDGLWIEDCVFTGQEKYRFAWDPVTAADGTTATALSLPIGTSWTLHGSYVGEARVDSNRLYAQSGTSVYYHSSESPPAGIYEVEADFHVRSVVAGDRPGVCLRINTAADTMYVAQYNADDAQWEILLLNAGTPTVLGTPFAQTLTVGQSYAVRFKVSSSTLTLFVDEVSRVSATDATISAQGKAGFRFGAAQTSSTGIHLDNIEAVSDEHCDVIQSRFGGRNHYIRRNRAYDNVQAQVLYKDGQDGYHNVVFENNLWATPEGKQFYDCHGLVMVNNTHRGGGTTIGAQYTTTEVTAIANNAFGSLGEANTGTPSPGTRTFSYQDFNTIESGNRASIGANDTTTAPVFVDSVAFDYRLASNSTAQLNTGTAGPVNGVSIPADDVEGRTRPIGAAPDMGAYERQATDP